MQTQLIGRRQLSTVAATDVLFNDVTFAITGWPQLIFHLKTRCRPLRVHRLVIRLQLNLRRKKEFHDRQEQRSTTRYQEPAAKPAPIACSPYCIDQSPSSP